MRFKRCERHPFTDTSRKRAALRRRQRLEQEALPLLVHLVAEAQPSEDAVMEARAVQWLEHERCSRALRADRWREVRRRLSAFSANEQAVLRDALHSYGVARFTLNQMPFDQVARDPHGYRQAPALEGGRNA